MHWKRRQATWPYLVALGGLFVLTVAAPTWWRRHRVQHIAHQPQRVERAEKASWSRPEPVLATAAADRAPALPPLAVQKPRFDEPIYGEPQLTAPSLAGAVVESDDYVVVDEPLVVAAPVADVELPMPEVDPVEADIPPSAVAESFAVRPGDRSVVVRDVPAPEAPSRPAFAIETLVRARDALVTLMEEAKRRTHELAEAAAAITRPPIVAASPMRVIVQSEDDRLAMIPDLAEAPAAPLLVEPLTPVAPAPAPHPDPPPAPPALLHRPTALIRDLEALTPTTPAAAWADRVLASLDQLTLQPAPESDQLAAMVESLRQLSSAGFNEALTVRNAAHQSAWIRASRALDRRLPVWALLLDERATRDLVDRESTPSDDAALLDSLHDVAAITAGAEEGTAWRQYLRLNDVAGLTSVGGDDYLDARRAAARDVLIRMADIRLTPQQREFLAQPPLVALERNLHPWASGETSLDALAAAIEKYELSGSLRDAEAIAELRLRMKWSDDPHLQALAEDINRNYRNANVRFALSAELFNRLIPPQEPAVTPVNDRIGEAEVHGRSRTETHARVRLAPDATVWRFGLEVEGTVDSQTYSDVGPARVRNRSHFEYEARKLIMVNRYGLHIWPAEAEVEGRNALVGIEGRLDSVPVVGALVEDVVRRRHREAQAAAMTHVKAKVKRQARERMDREADGKLHTFESRIALGLMAPLEHFGLTAEPLDMSTTAERAVVRLRLANEQQLGAHTPRPSAPSDSLASLQLHESAVNNAIRGLELDGRRITVGELHALLREKFSQRPEAPPADLPQKAMVEFAKHDAVRVSCDGDRVELTLNIVELRRGRDSIRNVGVHAFFRPVVDGLEVKLVRDGTLQFEGAHLRSGPRLVLHSVFGKMLRKDQEAPVLTAHLNEDPRLAGLMVTQLVIDDGWIALSVGPASPDRTAWRTRGDDVAR